MWGRLVLVPGVASCVHLHWGTSAMSASIQWTSAILPSLVVRLDSCWSWVTWGVGLNGCWAACIARSVGGWALIVCVSNRGDMPGGLHGACHALHWPGGVGGAVTNCTSSSSGVGGTVLLLMCMGMASSGRAVGQPGACFSRNSGG